MLKKTVGILICAVFLGTFFGISPLFSQGVSADLENVIVYPNPCNYSQGHNNIVFEHLTDEVTIEIYTLKGKLVFKTDSSNSGGQINWDAKNNAGEKLAAGLYIYLITNNQNQKATGKIVIIK